MAKYTIRTNITSNVLRAGETHLAERTLQNDDG